jgi:hypothetical protein
MFRPAPMRRGINYASIWSRFRTCWVLSICGTLRLGGPFHSTGIKVKGALPLQLFDAGRQPISLPTEGVSEAP